MTNWRNVSVALVGTILTLTVIIGILVYTSTIQTSGTISAVRTVNCTVYANAAATQPLTQINWGTLEPGDAVNVTVYVKNTGNIVVNYTVTAGAFTPSAASGYIAFSADLKGAKNLAPNTVIPIILTNAVSASAPPNTQYSYPIHVNATG